MRLKALHLPINASIQEVYKGDMIAVYNILHGRFDMDSSDFFTFTTNTHQTRGHGF